MNTSPSTVKIETPSRTLSYQKDGRALDYSIAIGLVLLSVALVFARYFEVIPTTFKFWMALCPAGYVIWSATLYRIVLHSTHEALRLASLDDRIDAATGDTSALEVIQEFID